MSLGRPGDHQLCRGIGDPRHDLLETYGDSNSWQDQKTYDMITGVPRASQDGIRKAQRVHRRSWIQEQARQQKAAELEEENNRIHEAKIAERVKEKMYEHEKLAALETRLRRTQSWDSLMESARFEKMMRQIQSSDLAIWQKQKIRRSKVRV